MKVTQYDIKPTGRLSIRDFVEVWGAHSESSKKIYTVALSKKGVWSCGCPRWTMNRNRPDCKHIIYIKKMREQKNIIKVEAVMPEQIRKKLSTFAAIEL